MEGRQSSMAQLSAWTETMSQKKNASSAGGASAKQSAKPAAAAADDDGYGDDFEDYADDFDDEPEEAPPAKPEAKKSANVAPPKVVEAEPPRASAKDSSGAKKQASAAATTAISQEIRINDIKKKSDNVEDANQSRSKKSNMFSLAGTFTDRRAARVQKLLQSGVLEMNSERVSNQLQLAPMTSFELYSTKLRSADATMKQIAIPTENEKRDVEANTEEITTADKSVQFTFTDDTAFNQAMEKIAIKKGGKKSISSTTTSSSGENASDTQDSSNREGGGGVGLSTFLRRSTNVFEALFKQMGAKSGNDTSNGSSDVRLGDSRGSTAANTMFVKYSKLQPSLLLTVQPGSGSDAKSQQMGHYLIWDAAYSPGRPIHHLSGSGVPTCACFSQAQASIVLAGTLEGSLHLWDLRDAKIQSSNSGDGVNINKPCFSTGLLVRSNSSDYSSGNDNETQHMYPIVQVKSLDFIHSSGSGSANAASGGGESSGVTAATISQFVSLDDSGLLIFWITSQDTEGSVFGGSSGSKNGSRTVLVQTRSLNVQSGLNRGLSSINGRNGTSATAVQGKHLFNTLLTTVPGDSSTLLVTSTAGSLHKLARFGDPTAPCRLCRAQQDLLTVSSSSPVGRGEAKEATESLNKEINYFSAISCVAVTNYGATDTAVRGVSEELVEVSSGGFVLAGRMDGTMDLFRLNSEQPLNSWNLVNLSGNSRSKQDSGVNKVVFVVTAQWCPFHKSLFTVVDSNSGVFVFDMSVDVIAPIHTETVEVSGGRVKKEGADVSYHRNTGPQFSFKECRISVAVCSEEDSSIRVRELSCGEIWKAINRSQNQSYSNSDGGEITTLGCWTSETYTSNLVSFASN